MSGQYKCTPTPWRLGDEEYLDFDEGNKRLIIGKNSDGEEVLIADTYPDSAMDLGLPESYDHNAAVMVESLEMYRALLALNDWEAANPIILAVFKESRAIIKRIQDRWETVEKEQAEMEKQLSEEGYQSA